MKYLFLVFISIFIAGCAEKGHTGFVSNMVSKYALDDFDMKNIQFYTSHDIILYKDNFVDYASVVDGKLVVNQQEYSNVIKIEAGTPCVVVCNDKKSIRVSFDNEIELTFLKREKCKQKSGKYFLAANKVEKNVATVEIQGETYIVQNRSGESYLTIDKEFFADSSQNSFVSEGKRVSSE